MTLPPVNSSYYFLQGGGEMGEMIRAHDWNKTELGDPGRWPQSLRTAVSIMLDNPFGMYIAWGKNFTQLYNDGYRPILGSLKHPRALGISTRETFVEIWETIGPMFGNVMKGIPIGFPDFMLPLNRHGFIEECYFDFSYSPIRKEDGEVGGVLVTVIETTKRKKAETALLESEQNLRNIILQAPVAMCLFKEPNFVVEVANDRMYELWGKPGEELLGKPIFEGLPEAKDQGFEQLLEGVYTTGKTFTAQELPITLPRNGHIEIVYVNFTYEAYREADGSISGIMAVATDVTPNVQARQQVQDLNLKLQTINKELAESNLQLTKINADLDNFIYTASHDLKAPMSNIEGLLNTLQQDLLSHDITDDTKMILQLMETSITRFKTTINDLTEITKLQKTKEEDINEINLDEILVDVKVSIQNKIMESKAIIQVDFSQANSIKFSKKNLRSILYNLISNSIKYRNQETTPEIYIATEKTDDYIILIIRDNGLGIDEKNKSKLFTMFKRFHDHVDGTGIGLYIVKRIVDNAEGKIEVESELGKGTTFKIYFKN